MKRSDYLLKENIGKKKEEKKPQKRSEKLLKNPVGMTSGAITSSTATEKPKTTAAPKVTTSKKDKSYTGVDAEINRREASRSARYSMQPEVRAAEIKRAEARGDTKRASELKKAKDIKQWAKEQVNSDFVKTRAQTVYDNEFNAAKLRGDQSPAVAAEHAAQGYLDMFRNKPQETRNETYAYRQAVRKNEYEGIDSRADYNERVIQGRAIIPQGKRDAGQSIIAYLNSPELRRQREERGEQFGDGSTILEHISVMTDAEKNRFRYLAATGDWEKVNDYYDLIKRDLNKRAQEETNKETYAESYNSPVKGTVKNVVAGFMTPGAYIATGANAIANKFRDDYIPVDTNSPMFAGAHMARETSSGVTERASDAVGGGTAGEIASLIAGTGLSMANFISKAPLGGVGSMVAMGLDSAGQTTLDVLERGGTEGQALLLGTAAGAIEAITEKLPLDNLFKIASEAGEKGLKATVKELLKQGAIEATEEMISELSNSILDVEVMRDKSEYQSYIATLMQNGMTREDAEKEAIFQIFGMKTLKAGASGFLSGLVMGGGATAVSKINTAIESRNAGAAEGEAYSLKKTSEESSAEETPKSESDEEAFRRAFGDWAYDPEEESSYFDETGLADDAAQNPKEDYSNIDSLYADLAKRENIIAEESDEREQELIDGAYTSAIAEPATEKKTLSEKVSESGNYLKRKIVNSGAAIRDIAKVTKDKFLYPIYNRERGSMNIAEDMLTNKQTNIRGEKVGESLESIILPIKNKGKEYFRDFQLYMLNKHNVARMSLENPEATARAKAELDKFLADNPQIAKLAALGEDAIQNASKWDDARGFRAKQYLELRNEWQKLLRTKNKPIFFDKEETPLSADISRTKAEELLKKHPEFAEHEAKVRKYLDNLMQYRVDSGLITQEEADYFRKKYPDYVPTYRNKESVLQELYGKKNIGKTLGIARGGVEKLLPLDIALAEMTKKVIKNGQKNIFTNKLFDIFEKNSKLFEEYITDANEGIRELDKQIDEFGEDDPKFKNTVSFYKDGKYIELTMTPKLYEAFAEMSKAPEEKAPVADWWRILNNGYKKLITTYDPTFIIRNGLKDLQDATINSRDTKAMLKNLPKAYAEIANGGELFELYKSMGGLHSSRFDEIKTKGVEKKSWAKKIPDALAFGNMMVEQAPRLAEFISVLEKGDRNDPDVLADALYAAADVTTNFGESGTWGKLLNAYYVPFLNPAIQGTAKIGRLITEPKTAKQWYGLAAKAIIMGVGAGFINDIIIGIFGDDEEKEEYEKLQDRVKDNYFLIPTDDGKFAKIPKGRIAASLGVIADRVRDVAKGEKVSAGEAVVRILENIAPENPITNNILSPFIDADLFNNESKGKTWYGGDIENDSLQGLPAGERFDSSTDLFSKYAGKALGLSPKKINYILKQYTGGIGRTVLPMITPSEQKGDSLLGVVGYGALSIITSNFMVDSKLSNKVSGEFYDAVSEAEQKKNSSKGTLADKVVYKHLNRERNQMSGYNKKIREAETDSSLTSKERDVAVRTATASRSEYQKEVLDNLNKYRANVEKYLKEYPGKDEEKAIDYAYRKANYATYGAEYAIRASGGKSVYDKALEKVNRGKTTWKEYYEEYFGKDERRYEKLREKYDISYAEYEAIAEAMSKNSTEEEEIEALHKLGYKRSTARGIRRNFNKVK